MKSFGKLTLVLSVLVLSTALETGTAHAQFNWWTTGDTVNIFNKNRGGVLIGAGQPIGKLTLGPDERFYNLALVGDYNNIARNYLKIGVLSQSAVPKYQGHVLFDLFHQNPETKYPGFNFRVNEKSIMFLNAEGNIGIGTELPDARLQIKGGPAWGSFVRALGLGTNAAIHFGSGAGEFGLVGFSDGLGFIASNPKSGAFDRPFLKLMTFTKDKIIIDADVEFRGKVTGGNITVTNSGGGNSGGGTGGDLGTGGGGKKFFELAAAPNEPASGGDGWLGGQTTGSIYYSQGPVGIGTNNPTIVGTSSGRFLEIADPGNPGVALRNTTAGGRQFLLYSHVSSGLGSFRIYDGAGGSDRFVISHLGNVGIGTLNPLVPLQVDGGNGNPIIAANVSSGYGSMGLQVAGQNKLLFGYNATNGNYGSQTVTGDVSIWSNANLHFNVSTGTGSYPTRMYIGTNGNVGIGKIPGAYALDVNGTVNATALMVNGSPVGGNAWTQTGNDIYYNTGKIGIGTSTPTTRVHITDSNQTPLFVKGTVTTNLPSTVWGVVADLSIGSNVVMPYTIGVMGNSITEGNSSTVNKAWGLVGAAWTSGTNNTITNAYGLQSYVSNNINGGSGNTVINGYGLYVNDVQANNPYGIYIAGADDRNFIAGKLGIGTDTASFNLQVRGTNDPVMIAVEGIGTGIPNFQGLRARGAVGALSAVQADDMLAIFGARAYGTTGYSTASRVSVRMAAAENWTDAAQGTYMVFYTTALGAAVHYERMRIAPNGFVGIGTTSPSELLSVNGNIRAKKVIVTQQGWADFVFADGYDLPTLAELEKSIKENRHLPDVPSEKEVLENGLDLGDMQAKLLRKIEELTLYVIEQHKAIEQLKKENREIQKALDEEIISRQSESSREKN